MSFPSTRLRRLRSNPVLRSMVRETRLSPEQLIAPIFLVPGNGIKKEISSLPGQFHLSVDRCIDQGKKFHDKGIPATLLFGVPEFKDETGSSSCQPNGIVQQGIRALKETVPGLLVIADVCFCEYTSHGHCGIIKGESVENDSTLEILQKQALSLAHAGVDILAPSGMMDGTVKALRACLDENGFSEMPILGYSAKFASSFYGPFREAVDSAPSFGDRRSYQMDPANIEEALREVELDIEEGVDMVMVKPALAFLDVIRAVKERFNMPTAAYNVSGEYAMVKAAAERGWIDGKRVMLEMLTSIRRAGADMIITYFAEEYADLYRKGEV